MGNPGRLRMYTYVPDPLPSAPALVVVLHGCLQTAAEYDLGPGWSTLADRFRFALLFPEQQRANNPRGCFNWFQRGDSERDQGEALSIRHMVEHMIQAHAIDRGRVFVTGLSAGGGMTSVMLAAYPEVFAGGAVIAGVPYRGAIGAPAALRCMFQGQVRSARAWGDLVRAAAAPGSMAQAVGLAWQRRSDGFARECGRDRQAVGRCPRAGCDPKPGRRSWTAIHGVCGGMRRARRCLSSI